MLEESFDNKIPEQKISDEEMIRIWLKDNEITVIEAPVNFHFAKMHIPNDGWRELG